MARKTGVPTETIPVRLSPELLAQVKEAARELNWKDVEVIRLCTQIGLVHMKKINYRIADVIYASPELRQESEPEHLKAAEKPGEYQAVKKRKA